MKISRNWLTNYISSDKTDNQLVDMFTQLGLECTVYRYENNFSDVFIGKVLKCVKHPNADKLKLCEIDLGSKVEEIICGAPNIKKGLTVPVAIIGSKVGDFKIKKVKIRDVYSYGMVCSGKELGINDDHDGIMILDDNLNSGENIVEALNLEEDSIFDFDITPNRGDCFSHLGIARELGIIENKKIKLLENKLNVSNFKTSDLVKVKIQDKNICSRYSCQIIKNIDVGNSPQWLKNKLNAIGQKSINNIVDLANYIMFDTGQPLHVFDYDKIKGEINIRLAKKGEELVSLDNITKKLSINDIVITDGKKPIAIAGVIGGLNSHVESNTKNILIESAVFDEIRIRKTSKNHDYSKEASKRFERGVDIKNTISSMNKFSTLLLETCSGDIASDYIDIYNNNDNRVIDFDMNKCNKFLGTNLSKSKFKEIFDNLNIVMDDKMKYLIPSYRNDLNFEVDLYEEIARVYGYDNIPSNLNFTFPSDSFIDDNELVDQKVRNFLSANGFNEHYSNSLYSKDDCLLNNKYKPVRLINPLSNEMQYIRNSLLPGLLRATSFNERRGKNFIKLFEIGNITFIDTKSYSGTSQQKELMVVWLGDIVKHWKNPIKQDIYSIKGEIKSMLNMLNISKVTFEMNRNNIDVLVNKEIIGYIKLIDKKIMSNYNLSNNVFICSINIDLLNNYYNKGNIIYNKIYSYPSIERDISILINKKFSNQEIQDVIIGNGGQYLKDVELFDLYQGGGVSEESKSLAYSLKFNSNDRTLTDKEIDIEVNKILKKLKDTFKVIQR
jgi:phenylalanyl-tRNA synthetase beta chain